MADRFPCRSFCLLYVYDFRIAKSKGRELPYEASPFGFFFLFLSNMYFQNYIYKTETMQTLAAPLISQLLVKPSTD